MTQTIDFVSSRRWFFAPKSGNPTWERDPYMVKEYTTYSDCGKFAATVVVIPREKTQKNRKTGETETTLEFFTTGVRIEWTGGRREKEGYVIPGSAYFVNKKTNVVSENRGHEFNTDRVGKLLKDNGWPILTKNQKERADVSVPIHEHPKGAFLTGLVRRAWERYDEYMDEKRSAA